MKRLPVLFLLAGLAWGQYAASQSGSAEAASEINSKPAVQSGAGGPSGNCTAGKDLWINLLTGVIDSCTSTNTWTNPSSSTAINSSSIPTPNFNNSSPGAQSGFQNALWQVTGSNISVEVPFNYAAGAGSAQAQTLTLSPAIPALAAGLRVRWLPMNANTGSGTTLAVNGLTATTITKCGQSALAANDLTTTAVAEAVYDGTNFELQNPQATACAIPSSVPYWINATISYTSAQTSATSNDVSAFSLPANATVLAVRIKEQTQFSGVTTLTVSLGLSGAETDYSPAWSLEQSVSATNMYNDGGSYSATTASQSVVAQFVSTGSNLSSLSAGSVEIWMLISVLPS